MKILVTGAGALLGQGIIRALRKSSLDVHIIAVDPNPLSVGLYWADSAHQIALANDPAYFSRFERVLEKERPDAVLVGTDVELPIFAEHCTRLESEHSTKILVSSPRVVGIADDKWQTALFMEEHGFAHPLSALPEDVDELIAAAGFPLIVKPRVGARSIDLLKVNNREELHAALRAGRKEIVIQECIGTPENEYTAGAICFGGKCRATIVMRRELRDGNTYRAFVGDYPELNAAVACWTEALGPFGPVNFQFRLDAGEQPKIFEINARFSGTTPLRAAAGFNEVEMTLRHVLLGEEVSQPRIKECVVLRHWSETVLSPGEILKNETASVSGSGTVPDDGSEGTPSFHSKAQTSGTAPALTGTSI